MREELAQRIENEFAKVPYPGDQNIGVREVEGFIGQKEWQKVPLEVLAHNQTAILMFSPEAYRFYLPAFLCALLRHPELEYLEDPVVYKLIPSDSDDRNPEQAIHLFRKDEKMLIVEFLEKHGKLFPQSSYALLEDSVAALQRGIQFRKVS